MAERDGPKALRKQRRRKRPAQEDDHERPAEHNEGTAGELGRYLESVLPGAERLDTVQVCLEHVRLLVRQLCGDTAAVVVQGSYAQGLALRGSDLDVAVIPEGKEQGKRPQQRSRAAGEQQAVVPVPEEDVVDKRRAIGLLRRLANAIADLGHGADLRVALRIFTAQVPVLRLHGSGGAGEGASGGRTPRVVIDVSVGRSLARGACDRCVHALLRTDTSGIAAALCRLVKVWAKRKKLTDTLRGGLSSFAFVLLVIFFLQSFPAEASLPQFLRLPPHEAITRTASLGGTEGNCSQQHGGLAAANASEVWLAKTLSAFFAWAVEKLPEYGQNTLSVVTGKAEPRRDAHAGGSSWSKPLILEVPFQPQENAARCLRGAVWEASILPELARARQLAARVAGCSGRRRAVALRALFAARGTARGQEAEEEDEAYEASRTDDAEEDSHFTSFRKGRPAKRAAADSGDAPAGDGDGTPDLKRRKPNKRRRSDGGSWADKMAEIRSPHLAPMPPPVVQKGAAAPAVSVQCPASMNRWLGLRAMLNPT